MSDGAAAPHSNIKILEDKDLEDSVKFTPEKQPGSPMGGRSKATPNDHVIKSVFMTGANFSGKKAFDEKPAKIEEVIYCHDKLNNYIEQLDHKVKSRLQDNQASFLMAYKEQMMIIQKELQILKKKVDEETYKRKNDERMNILEQERDWFRAEAIRLDKVCKEQQRQLQELKFKLKIVNEDKTYYEDFVMAAKKENKDLKEELMLLETGKKTGEEFMQSPPVTGKTMSSNLKRGQLLQSSKRGGTASRKGDERTEESLKNATESLKEFASNKYVTTTGNEEKFLEVIRQLKEELDREKRVNRQLRNEKSQLIVGRIELEQILVESINEVKKDISKRKSAKTYKDIDRGPVVPLDVDLSKFSATDKNLSIRNLVEYFISNEVVLRELYNLVFSGPGVGSRTHTQEDFDRPHLYTSASTRSEGKLKYSFNYGFGNPGNMRLAPTDLTNIPFTPKTQTLMNELKKPDSKKGDGGKKEL